MALQDALCGLMATKPFPAISVTELCVEADVNRTTFYSHYQDQACLLEEIESAALESVNRLLDGLKGQAADEILRRGVHMLATDEAHLGILLGRHGDPEFQEELFSNIFARCGIKPTTKESTPHDLDFAFVLGGSVSLLQRWMETGKRTPERDVAAAIARFATSIA
ncbi:MAG: TetR family transcriptional regulator C-terminal domain-containing protein [Atopobiaceae bacterium]|nr:TetR family transcriptional regulator C-terminal domain-containing protein [Atopobiaceae bacterium]MCI2174124.1 TetR family transcriptional regulator C-terminal domain-containing protein [Atopobiaceae bacterium]MCI2206765.1 TetR family transcriptional regulator C-terminal domain-containing protein [Atopobiaceae bacterium]